MELQLPEPTLFADKLTLFAEVMLPVPIPSLFTYRVPFELNDYIQPGVRVVVQFGKRRILTAIVVRIHDKPPKDYQAKYILELLDEQPVVNEQQFRLWDWIADYYMCTIGEVMNVALPAGLKLSSQSRIQLNPDFEHAQEADIEFSDKEQRIIDALRKEQSLTFDQASEIINQQNIYNLLKSLIRKGAILIYEELKDKYKPKLVKKVRLSELYASSMERLTELLGTLSKNPKQEEVLLRYLSVVPLNNIFEQNAKGVLKSELLQTGISESSLNTLVKNEVLEQFDEIVSRFEEFRKESLYQIQLTEHQQAVSDRIMDLFQSKDTVLLHGITGSGKTEIYIDLIQKALENGTQVLFLLPEIALTTQIVARLKKVFGDQMGVYHSKFSDNERVEVWKGIMEGKFPLVVGVRSSILLPFSQLGLIIVDEEHDPSYKQYDPAPRYNARDIALVLANIHHAKVLLGSATPSVESYYLAEQGRYGFARADKRYGDAQLPEIRMVDMRQERQQKKMKNDFSSVMLFEIKEALLRKEQVILFQNRRGYAPHLTCDECNMIPRCENCSVSLTYHMYNNELRCHYCGHKEAPPMACLACGSTKIKTVGFGTEKIEDELKLLVPDAKVQRMDLDTTRSKHSYQNIIQDFSNRDIDILVGTQMVTKGLDFDDVSLVGVFDVDRMLHFPDFRSFERTFQLITQVSGRAGRKSKKGTVLIQTSSVNHALLQKVLDHNYEAFYEEEIRERSKYLYPPFTRMIRLTVKSEDQPMTAEGAEELAAKLRAIVGDQRVLGPEVPIIDRIRNQYLKDIVIKLERDKLNLKQVKQAIAREVQAVLGSKKLGNKSKQLYVVVDVDPV